MCVSHPLTAHDVTHMISMFHYRGGGGGGGGLCSKLFTKFHCML